MSPLGFELEQMYQFATSRINSNDLEQQQVIFNKKLIALFSVYVTGKMDVFASRQICFAWIDQAKWIWNYFRSYLFV